MKPLLALALLTACAATATPLDQITFTNRIEGTVTKIVDGDTWYLDTEPIRVRAWGYGVPECYGDGSCDTAPATRFLNDLIMGKALTCEWVGKRTSYDRKVVRCHLPNGSDIGALMIASDLAVEDCRFSKGYYGGC